MADPALVASIEGRLVNAWPSFEVQVVEGWLLRFAKGYSKRANAASPLAAGARLDDALIGHIADQYARQSIRPTFRLTSLEAPEADERLAGQGFVEIEPSWGMVAAIDPKLALDPAVTIEAHVPAAWVQAAATAYGGEKADGATLHEIVSRIRHPAAFATLSTEDEAVAWGLAVAERGYVGLYDIVVAPNRRGFGLGRRLVSTLMAWGRGAGARDAYLQVRETNETARRLYRSFGFEDVYRYTHRVRP